MAYINPTKSQTIYYHMLINLQIIRHNWLIIDQLPFFLQLLRHHFQPSNKLHKIFNKNTVKVRYCCTQKVASIIKSHNKKLINTSIKNILPCNCRKKHECPLDDKCRAENIVYKCIASVDGYTNKVFLGTAGGAFRQRFYNHRKSFNN